MVEYGYINENGYLVSKRLSDYVEKYKDENEEIQERIITVEMQISSLVDNGLKPVDLMDESLRICENGYHVRIIPYDAGDHIAYNYQKVPDIQKNKYDIKALKDQLLADDYKITKCYEASLVGMELPYNISELHQKRQAIRDEINRLEAIIASIV